MEQPRGFGWMAEALRCDAGEVWATTRLVANWGWRGLRLAETDVI
jgi:hypothetical protein